MTYQEFRDKYNGQYVDVDGYPKEQPYQCFDLAQQYCTEALGLPSWVLAGCKVAKNFTGGERIYLKNRVKGFILIYVIEPYRMSCPVAKLSSRL